MAENGRRMEDNTVRARMKSAGKDDGRVRIAEASGRIQLERKLKR